VDRPQKKTSLLDARTVSAALVHGVPTIPAVTGEAVIAAAGSWGSYGVVIALRRDEDGDLLNDVYLLARSPDGRWPPPNGSSGSGMPEWVLQRPLGPLADWRGSELVSLEGQVALVAGRWVAELTVMASVLVTTVEVTYGGDTIRVPVPASGLVTLPGAIRSVDDVAEFRGYDDAGRLCAGQHYQPLTDVDRRLGWPDDALWATRRTDASPT
jgi:hypothetical protein